ncbi:unnamed protein product, partial [Chrysoparadoxa australica]
ALTPFPQAQVVWLLLWTANNIGVTLLNKASFSRVHFPYPWTLSAIHMACNWLGTALYFNSRPGEHRAVEKRHYRTLYMFSLVFAANIAVGNISLKYVSVSFNQVMRSLVPGVVMVARTYFFQKETSFNKKLSVVPVIIGVALACFGEMSFTALGFFVTVGCVVLAAMKVVLSGEMLTGDIQLPPMCLLSKMAPLALMHCSIMATFSGELGLISEHWNQVGYCLPSEMIARPLRDSYAWHVVLLSGLSSFSLNICSLKANKLTSPLTLTIVSNVKQVLLIVLGTVLFATPMSAINALGVVIVCFGSFRF